MKKNRLRWMVITALMCGMVQNGSVFGAEPATMADESYTLDPVLVTAQRTETHDLETPASTVVLTKEDIDHTGANTVFDALSFTPGITNFSYGAGGLDYGAMDGRVNIRGLERSALVLVNGAPINLNGKNSLSGIIPEDVNRVEIVKGASSTLYGAEAMGGVINIITERPEQAMVRTKLSVGNLGSKRYSVLASTPDISIGVSKDFFGALDQTSPIRKDIDGKKGYEYYNDRGKGDMFNLSLSARLSEKWNFNFMRSVTNSTYGQIVVPGTITKPKITEKTYSKRYHYNDKKNIASLIYKYDDTMATFYYSDRDLYGETRNLASAKWTENDSNYRARKYGADVQHEWNWNNDDTLVAGVMVSRDTYQGTSKATTNVSAGRNSMALYGSYTHNFTPRLSTVVGARFQTINDPVKNQNVVMPQWQMLYKVNDNASWYTNIGKAFTMPNLSDTYKFDKGVYRAISGPNLKPEEGWNYEIGYKHITDKESWKIGLFYMDFKNFFDWAPNPEDGNRKTIRINGGKFQNIGIEADYRRLLTERLTLSLGGSYSNPKNQAVGSYTWNQTYPKLQITAGLAYDDGRWNAGTALNWLTKRLKNRDGSTNPDLINWNVYIGYTFSNSDSLRVQLNNILDRENVITNGAWEYWDEPFNYTISYEHRF